MRGLGPRGAGQWARQLKIHKKAARCHMKRIWARTQGPHFRQRSAPSYRKMRPRPTSRDEYLQRYPRIFARIIAESLGYAVPEIAAQILKDAREGSANYCEWIYACFRANPR